jgi:exportin-2 (importin alpha re-exporter)
MAELPSLFRASLDPQTRKQAETTLSTYASQDNFSLHLLSLTLDGTQDRAIRLAASVYLKNLIRKAWAPVSISYLFPVTVIDYGPNDHVR